MEKIKELEKFIKNPKVSLRNVFFLKNKRVLFLSWPYLVIYYIVARQLVNSGDGLIAFIILLFLILRMSFIKISLFFFIIGVVAYIFGYLTEADHYMSFVFGFLAASIILELNNILLNKHNA